MLVVSPGPGQGRILAGRTMFAAPVAIGSAAFRPRRPRILRGRSAAVLMLLLAAVAGAGVRAGQPIGRGAQPAEKTANNPPGADHNWSIPGAVVDAAGKPVAGASVRMIGRSGEPAEVVSGPDGRFLVRVPGPMENRARLVATADGGRLQGLGTFVESNDSSVPSAPVRITLAPGRSVEVAVNDGKARPVPDARVELLSNGQPLASSRTDATGRAVVHYPAEARVNAVVAFRPFAGLDYFENDRAFPPIGDPPPLPDAISLTLDGARTLRVRAVDTGGRPVAGVVLHPQSAKRPSKLASVSLKDSRWTGARTDREGIAKFGWLPADLEGSCPIMVEGTAYHVLSDENTPTRAGTAAGTIRLVRTVALRGRVVHPDGQPAAGIVVCAEGMVEDDDDRAGDPRGLARTGPEGTYELIVPADHTYILGVDDRNLAARSHREIDLGDAGPAVVPDLALIHGTEIRGRFRLGPEARPIAGHTILLDEIGGHVGGEDSMRYTTLRRRCETDRDGRFRFRIGPGEYKVSIIQGAQIDRFARSVADEDVMELDWHLMRGGTRLTGRVLDGRGGSPRPVAGAMVTALDDDDRWNSRARADADGRFEMIGPAPAASRQGGKRLYARSPDGSIAAIAGLGPGQTEVDIELRPAARLTGHVVDATGRPLEGWGVQVWLSRDENAAFRIGLDHPLPVPLFSGLRFDAVTDGEGRYIVTGLPVGTSGQARLDNADTQDAGPIRVNTRSFRVEGPAPITLPGLIAPSRRRPADVPE